MKETLKTMVRGKDTARVEPDSQAEEDLKALGFVEQTKAEAKAEAKKAEKLAAEEAEAAAKKEAEDVAKAKEWEEAKKLAESPEVRAAAAKAEADAKAKAEAEAAAAAKKTGKRK